MSEEKNEAPTEKKLEDARREGKAAKSADLVASAQLLVVTAGLSLGAGAMGAQLRKLMTLGLDIAHRDTPALALSMTAEAVAQQTGLLLIVVLAAALFVPITAFVMQIGFQISMEPLTPNMDAVNPATGVKRLFSLRSLLELVKTIVKAVVLVEILYKVVWLLMPTTAALAYQNIDDVISVTWQVLSRFLMVSGLVYFVLGAVDFGIQKWMFLRDHRMSKDEVKREYKQSEGDPEIKQKRKQIARELANSPSASRVAQAQAVVVNPTHYAVAIRYAPEEYGLPRVIAKGVDLEAAEIREAADRAHVPLIPHAPLARALYLVPLNHTVPEPLLEAVAEVLAWVRQFDPALGPAV
jgi:type III secretion protein U